MQILGKFLGHDIVSFNDGTTHPIPVVEINSALPNGTVTTKSEYFIFSPHLSCS